MTTEVATTVPLSMDEMLTLVEGQDFWTTRAFPHAGIPSVRLADGPHGIRLQAGDADHLGIAASTPSTCFPPAATLSSSWDLDLIEEVGAAVGREARTFGVGVVLGPGLNIKRHPMCGRNFEYYSEDPLLSGMFAAAAVRGIQHEGVGACLKHFAVNNQEHRRFVIDAVVDERTRRELYLRGFEIAVKESAPRVVMAAYNRVNGVHCADDHELLTGVLRDEWGFAGAVVSDWGAENDRVAGIRAGMDLEMPGGVNRLAELRVAVNDGRLPAAAVADSARRIADLADLANDAGASTLPEEMVEEHDAIARRAAAASAVVLTNNGTLPLAPTTRVALIGAFAEQPRYQGSGSSLVTPTRITTAHHALSEAGVDVTFAAGYEPVHAASDEALIAEAVQVAKEADVAVVMVGLPGIFESEGFDRDHLELPAQHNTLIAAVAAVAPRTVVLLSNGSPVLMPWVDQVDAVVECYLGGQASGGAVADILLGVVEPAGRLAETFPAAQADVAADPYFPGGSQQVQYREGLFVGYRHTTTHGIAPLFPFGHGLGYGRTEWSSIIVDHDTIDLDGTVTISVIVTNTGDCATSDVVQVYSHDQTGIVLRPRRELVGYAKVHLPVGTSSTVRIEVPTARLAFWDTRSGSWQVPGGVFTMEVGRSSEQIEAALPVTVHGGVSVSAEPPSTPAISVTDADFARRLGRPIPAPRATRPFTRDTTMGDLSVTIIGRMLRSIMNRSSGLTADTDPATAAMMARATDELPLRGLVQFSAGKTNWRFVDSVIMLANRRPFAAIRGAFARVPRP